MRKLAQITVCLLLAFAPTWAGATPQPPQVDFDAMDPAYPDMARWAVAGIRQVPATDLPVITLQPGDDLAAAVAVPGRIVQLFPGDYPIAAPLRFADRVILRGAGVARTRLVITLRGTRPREPDEKLFVPWTSAVLLETVEQSGIENLTLLNDPGLPPPPDPRKGSGNYTNNPLGLLDLHVVPVRFSGSRDCWMQHVVIKNAGQHPLVLESSEHLTIDHVEIDGAYNKGANSGSLLISGSFACLIDNVTVTDIARLVFDRDTRQRASQYNVIIRSRLSVDVHFHDPRSLSNLLQECVIEVPAWHPSPAISME